MNKSRFIFTSILTLCIGLVLLPCCATQSPAKEADKACGTDAAASPNAVSCAASANTSPDAAVEASVVVPTEVIKGETAAEGSAEQPMPLPSTLPEPYNIYRIGPGDLLRFLSFDDEQLSTEVAVRYDGCISLPVIPDLRVQDLTREEAEALLKKAYTEFYPDPRVTLTVLEAKGKTFTVMGEVTSPAEYPYLRPISLLDAISAAGGIRVNQQGGNTFVGAQGQLVKALVIRHEGTERRVQDYDLRGFNKSGPSPSDALVLPGDVVYVPESANLVYLLGEVARPSVFSLSEGLTLTRLLVLGGGFVESTARLKQVVLLREVSRTETKVMTVDVRENMKLGKDVLLQPGDIVYVPRKRLVNAAEFVSQLTAPARSVIDFQRQIFGLYRDAYDAYYTKDRYDQLFDDNSNLSTSAVLQNAIIELRDQTGLKTIPNK